MPKASAPKFYAVLNGRGGPWIYDDWHQYRKATLHFSGASGKSFVTFQDARKWLEAAGVQVSDENIPVVGNAMMIQLSSIQLLIAMPQRSYTLREDRHRAGGRTDQRKIVKYPNSSTYWDDYTPQYVEAAVQCSLATEFLPIGRPLSSPGHRSRERSVPAAIAPPSNPLNIQLSAEQLHVLNEVRSGRNVFFTGPAGTGKSVLLREIIVELRRAGRKVAITASTGIAGLNIGGTTLHSFAGIGLGREEIELLISKIRNSDRLAGRWRGTDILIVDEISMIDAKLFDKLECIARLVREKITPFGGIQLVLSGDFFQLPPVPDQSHNYAMPSTYAFDAESWRRCISKPIFLTQVFRQKDNTFVELLAAMRTATLSARHIKLLQQLSRPLHYDDGIEPSQLFSLRVEVESCNNARLNALEGQIMTYRAFDSAGYDVHAQPIPKETVKGLLDRIIALPSISLKVGAQVMLIQNIEQGVLVNGSIGKVVDFLTTGEALARHIAIARPPGSDQRNNRPPSPLTKYRQAMCQKELIPLNDNTFTHKELWPMVRFESGRELLCAPMELTVEGFLGNVEARRLQVPLILAWALSIHKSQGQTLTRVKIDLGRVFERGQAYVAISRATSMEHLELRNFDPGKVMVNPRVLEWQRYWTDKNREYDTLMKEMDSEEAISHYFLNSS